MEIGQILTLKNVGIFLMAATPVLLGWLIWQMMISAFERLGNALSRIAEALDRIAGRVVTVLVILTILTVFIYGAFFSSGVKGVKATQDGKSFKLQVEETQNTEK